MAVTASQVVSQLEKHLVQNGSYYWKKYGLKKGTAWCAASVSASFDDAGAKDKFYGGKPVFYVTYAQHWLQKNCKHVPLSDVRRGDVIIFTWDGNGYNNERGSRDHIGFARSASSGNTLHTIEGNTNGGKVATRERPAKYIYGVYRPNMDGGSPAPTPPKDEPLEVDGIMGYNTKRLLQKFLGVEQDGVIGKNTTKALQRKVGLTNRDVDGAWGKKTNLYLQRYLTKQGFPTVDDGIMGKNTVKSLQRFLNKYFFGSGGDTPTPKPTPTPTPTPSGISLAKVIDISAWQGVISVDGFRKAKADGVTAVILRCSYTSQKSFSLHIDKVFKQNIANAKSAGLPVGVYHYSQAITVAEAKKEAEYVISIISGMKLELPVAFDWEFGGRLSRSRAMNNGKATNKKICDAFCNTIQSAGFVPMVYANLDTLNNYISNDLSKSWKVWVAQYNKTCDYKYPRYLWQYTSSGKVNGLSGRIDMNKG